MAKKFSIKTAVNEVYTIWPDGSHRTVISDGDSYSASWSPDGQRIAFLEDPQDDHISISEVDGTVEWLPVEKGMYQTIGAPVWSPDGTRLLFIMSCETPQQKATHTFVRELAAEATTPIKIATTELKHVSWQAKP